MHEHQNVIFFDSFRVNSAICYIDVEQRNYKSKNII